MTDPDEKPDERYDEAAVRKMAELWALMFKELTSRGVPVESATAIVIAWVTTTLSRPT